MISDRVIGTVKGVSCVLSGLVIWIGCAWIRPSILGITFPEATGLLLVVFLTGFILVLAGTGIILLKNNMWGS